MKSAKITTQCTPHPRRTGQPLTRDRRIQSAMDSGERSRSIGMAKRNVFRRTLISLLFIFTLAAATGAGQDTTVRSQSNLVSVPALVKDAQGRVVYGLTARDFVLDDDDVEQTVRLDEAPEGQPVSLVLAIQKGRRASYEFGRIAGLKTMLSPLFAMGRARVAVVEFDSRVVVTRGFSSDENLIDRDFSDLHRGDDGAAILDAINNSIGLLRSEPDGRLRVLLLISETRDHGSRMKIENTVAAVGQANALFYALAFSPALSNILDTGRGNNTPLRPGPNEMHPEVNLLDLGYRTAQAMRRNVPETVTRMTGGEYELFATRKRFDLHMNDFTNHLHSRYLLSFTPQNPHPGLHRIQVRLTDRNDSTVLARTNYWVESPR